MIFLQKETPYWCYVCIEFWSFYKVIFIFSLLWNTFSWDGLYFPPKAKCVPPSRVWNSQMKILLKSENEWKALNWWNFNYDAFPAILLLSPPSIMAKGNGSEAVENLELLLMHTGAQKSAYLENLTCKFNTQQPFREWKSRHSAARKHARKVSSVD